MRRDSARVNDAIAATILVGRVGLPRRHRAPPWRRCCPARFSLVNGTRIAAPGGRNV
jgi:hypothetical protein